MIRFVLRFVGLWLLAAAFIFLIYDGTKSIADHTVYFTRIVDVWSAVHQNSLVALQPVVERSVPWLWNPGLVTVLAQPAFLGLGILGALFTLLGRKKKPLIGYSRS
jgi:hypothetical protein